jgi:ribosomal protein S4
MSFKESAYSDSGTHKKARKKVLKQHASGLQRKWQVKQMNTTHFKEQLKSLQRTMFA